MAGAATALTTIALTVYALTTKIDIAVFDALGFIVCIAMLPIFIIGLFVHSAIIHTLITCFGVFVYSIYLIMDTLFICKGEGGFTGKDCGYDDYIIGSMMLYTDIIMIFIYILRLLGGED